jgi:hypothetical protein
MYVARGSAFPADPVSESLAEALAKAGPPRHEKKVEPGERVSAVGT